MWALELFTLFLYTRNTVRYRAANLWCFKFTLTWASWRQCFKLFGQNIRSAFLDHGFLGGVMRGGQLDQSLWQFDWMSWVEWPLLRADPASPGPHCGAMWRRPEPLGVTGPKPADTPHCLSWICILTYPDLCRPCLAAGPPLAPASSQCLWHSWRAAARRPSCLVWSDRKVNRVLMFPVMETLLVLLLPRKCVQPKNYVIGTCASDQPSRGFVSHLLPYTPAFSCTRQLVWGWQI